MYTHVQVHARVGLLLLLPPACLLVLVAASAQQSTLAWTWHQRDTACAAVHLCGCLLARVPRSAELLQRQ